MEKTFAQEALGCRTNQYEKEAYAEGLRSLGYRETSENATLCIINTCTVTRGADSSSRHAIKEARRKHPKAKIIVTGCLAPRDPASLEAIEGVFAVVPNNSKEALLHYILEENEKLPEFAISNFSGHSRAFVKVQDGCNSFCSYCIIPYVRGRSRSRSSQAIISEVERLLVHGYKEIVLTGINVGDFKDNEDRLSTLVTKLDDLEGLKRLRISSIDPDDITQDLEHAIQEGKTTCPSMHIVLQSGSNVILKRMYRNHTRQQFCDVVRRFRSKNENFTVTTDVIVGFPGETDGDFEETLRTIEEAECLKVHVFPYSDRPGTKASTFENKVPDQVITKRKEQLLEVAASISSRIRQRYVGKTVEILTEEHSEAQFLSGHTTNFLPVTIQRGALQPNQLVTVKLTSNGPETLFAEELS